MRAVDAARRALKGMRRLDVTDPNDAQTAWRDHDTHMAGRTAHADAFESYPSGSGDTNIAKMLQDTGMLYACNLALHGAGFALAVIRTPADDDERKAAERRATDDEPLGEVARVTGPIVGLSLALTLDPEGITFDELGHRESLRKMPDELVGVLAHRFGEAHARLVREAEKRERRARD